MFSNGPLDFFYAAHHQMASSVLNMTFSIRLKSKGFFSSTMERQIAPSL
jgi:hypothetical protein